VARIIALCFCDTLNSYPKSFQVFVLEKFFNNPLVETCVPKYLQDLARIKENHLIVDNLKCGLSNHLKRPKDLTPCHGEGHCLWLTMSNKSCNGR
jgi:hypothetical protein